MNKLFAILQGKVQAGLVEAKAKRILSQLSLARANKVEEIESSKDLIEELLMKFGEKDISSENSEEIITQLVNEKIDIKDFEETLIIIDSLISDLNSEVVVEE